MICEKCGLKIQDPELECPRCGYILPKEILQRATVESGSLDAWSEDDSDFQFVEEEKKGLRAYIAAHPSAPFFFGAIGVRVTTYLVGIILALLSEISLWSGWGIVCNCLFAGVAAFLILFQPEERDFYWFKTITSIVVLVDAAVTLLILAWPAIEWIFQALMRFSG